MTDIDNKFQEVFPNAPPTTREGNRHRVESRSYRKEEAAYMKRMKRAYGVQHFGVWPATGQATNQAWEHSNAWCHQLTQDTRGGRQNQTKTGARALAAQEYSKDILAIEIGLAALYKATDLEGFNLAKAHRDLIVDAIEGFERYSPLQCHLAFARVSNKAVINHKGKGDWHATMATLTCFSDFAGGDFILPTLGHRVAVLPGDAIIMYASLFGHCVAPFTGDRTSLVFFSKSDKDSIVKHRSQMTGDDAVAFDEVQEEKKKGS